MTGIKEEVIGLKKENRNNKPSMYNIRCDSDLSVSKASIRRNFMYIQIMH